MGKPQRRYYLTNLDTTETKEVKVADSSNIEERHFRSMDYNSVLRSDTIPIKFPRDGGRMLDKGGYYFILDAKDARGVKARVQLDIERLNPFTDDYEPSFTGVLEFNPHGGYTREDEYISVKAVDSRKLAKFKERDEINYDVFSLVSSDNITVPDFNNPYIEALYPPIDLYLKSISDGIMPLGTFTFSKTSYGEWAYQGELTVNEIVNRNLIDGTEEFIIYENNLTQTTSIINTEIDSDLLLVVIFSVSADATINGKLSWVYTSYDSDDVEVAEESIVFKDEDFFVRDISPALTGFNISANTTDIAIPDIDIEPEGYLKFSLRLEVSEVSGGSITSSIQARSSILDPTHTVSRFQFYEKTDGWEANLIRGMYPHEVGSRLIQLMTSETDTSKLLYSTILGHINTEFQKYYIDGLLSREFATNGFLLRQLIDRALNINFKDWFRSLSAISPIGIWYDKANDIFIIEDIEEFFKAEMFPINLGQAKDIKTTDFKELYFNTIMSGYPKTEYEDYQGANEINTLTEHEISIEVKNKADFRSPLFGDSVGQESARRKNISKFASQDTKYDNNVYLTTLNISNEVVQGNITDESGFIGLEQYYNLQKTPRQNLQRQSPLLIAPLYKDISEIITFRSSVKDTNIAYTDPDSGSLVNEFDNIIQPGLRTRLIDPELDTFEGLYTEEIANEIELDPHRIMLYTDSDGDDQYGYIWEVVGNRKKGVATYKLIKVNPERIP